MKAKGYYCLLLVMVGFFASAMSPDMQKPGYVSLDNAAFAAVLADSSVRLIDVRSAEEYAEDHIPGAMNINVNRPDFERRIDSLDRGCPVAVYCRSGSRSKVAARRLSERGFTVYELDRGFVNWDGARSVE